MGRSRKAAAAGTLVLALVATACGNGSGASDGGGGGAYGGGGGGYASSRATPTDATSSDSGGTTEGSGGKTLTQVNYQFTPSNLKVRQGDTITVSDTNPTTPHTFTVEGTDIDVANDAQSSQEVTIDLDPGSYAFFCRFHRAQGMEGTLTVT
jgi:plastocyanin